MAPKAGLLLTHLRSLWCAPTNNRHPNVLGSEPFRPPKVARALKKDDSVRRLESKDSVELTPYAIGCVVIRFLFRVGQSGWPFRACVYRWAPVCMSGSSSPFSGLSNVHRASTESIYTMSHGVREKPVDPRIASPVPPTPSSLPLPTTPPPIRVFLD